MAVAAELKQRRQRRLWVAARRVGHLAAAEEAAPASQHAAAQPLLQGDAAAAQQDVALPRLARPQHLRQSGRAEAAGALAEAAFAWCFKENLRAEHA